MTDKPSMHVCQNTLDIAKLSLNIFPKVENKQETGRSSSSKVRNSARECMTRMLLVALSVAGRRAKQPTGAPNASHHGGKNSNCRRCVQNEGDVSRWCGRITARDEPGTPDILVTLPLVSIHNSP